MSDASKAVFLSYASQDAAAAQRICEALRAAGVEVWFDQSELRGGDAWDAKIRRQIKECALFVPIISASTQARAEGYFRLEWKLAVDRSHLMSDDHPFLFPVVIDDTPDATARVPDRFKDVQWTRLDLRDTPEMLAARVAGLLAKAGDGGGEARPPAPRRAGTKSGSWWSKAGMIVGVIFALAFGLSSMWTQFPRDKPRPGSPPAKAQPTQAQQLAAQARALFEPWDGATREEFALAEQLLKRAVDLDPGDGEVCAAYGLVLCGQLIFGHERARAKWELAQSVTERAAKLAPGSDQARFAQAFYYRFADATKAQAESMLRELAGKHPTDKLIGRTLAAKLRNDGSYDEALAILERVAALPGGDPVAVYNKYLTLWNARRYDEAEAVVDEALRRWDAPYLHRAQVKSRMQLHGDLDGAAAALAKISPAFQLEDGPVFSAAQLWLWRREPEKCLAALQGVTREIVENDYGGPKSLLAGLAHQMAGRPEAAKVEWSAALQVADKQLAGQPNSGRWNFWRALLLAYLGRKTEAETALRTYEQLSGLTEVAGATAPIYLALGRVEEVVPVVEKYREAIAARKNPGDVAIFVNTLRHDPDWDPLRNHPRFQALLGRPPPGPK